jgi:hypothetical protein
MARKSLQSYAFQPAADLLGDGADLALPEAST